MLLLTLSDAGALTIGNLLRSGSLSSAIDGEAASGTGSLTPSVVSAAFSGTWINEGTVNSSTPGQSNDLLSITLDQGNWNGYSASGTWSIDPSFWSLYANAVIGWKVGNGSGDPDFFLFEITPGQTSGTWDYDSVPLVGATFSNNIQLYGGGAPSSVPEGGSTAALMSLAAGGIVTVRKFLRRS